MRKKTWKRYGILLFGTACVFLSGCAKPERTVTDIHKSGVIRVGVGVNTEYPEKQRYLSAAEQELTDRLCEADSVTAEYVFYQPVALEGALADGKADIGMGALKKSEWKDRKGIRCSDEYEQKFLFSVTPRGDYKSSVKALANQNIGVSAQIGEVEKQQIYQADGITLVSYDTVNNAARDLKINVISSYICFQNQAEELEKDRDLQIQDLAATMPETRVVLVKAENKELLSQVNGLIQEIKKK